MLSRQKDAARAVYLARTSADRSLARASRRVLATGWCPLALPECTAVYETALVGPRVPLGLVHTHISSHARPSASLYPSGMRVSARTDRPHRSWFHAPRGRVYGLSASSRRRLAETLARIDWLKSPSLFLSLTYHHSYSPEPEQWHAHLNRWEHALERDWGPFVQGGVAVLEFQARGAPHFHIVLVLARDVALQQFRRWNDSAWNRIAEPDDDVARRVGCRVDRLDPCRKGGIRSLMGYLASYVGKASQKRRIDRETGEILPTGRMWSVFRQLPLETVAVVDLTSERQDELLRRIRRWGRGSRYLESAGKRFGSMLIYGSAAQLGQLLRGLVDPTAERAQSPP